MKRSQKINEPTYELYFFTSFQDFSLPFIDIVKGLSSWKKQINDFVRFQP